MGDDDRIFEMFELSVRAQEKSNAILDAMRDVQVTNTHAVEALKDTIKTINDNFVLHNEVHEEQRKTLCNYLKIAIITIFLLLGGGGILTQLIRFGVIKVG